MKNVWRRPRNGVQATNNERPGMQFLRKNIEERQVNMEERFQTDLRTEYERERERDVYKSYFSP